MGRYLSVRGWGGSRRSGKISGVVSVIVSGWVQGVGLLVDAVIPLYVLMPVELHASPQPYVPLPAPSSPPYAPASPDDQYSLDVPPPPPDARESAKNAPKPVDLDGDQCWSWVIQAYVIRVCVRGRPRRV